jgi:hypothetical protein
MNLTESIAPRSDQLNADDLIGGPVTVTVIEVRSGTPDQPVNVVTEEFGAERPYKPSKSMRRVLVMAWGAESAAFVGRKLTLFRNPAIRFGKEEVGGIQISHMSHIDAPISVALTVTRGKRAPFTVQPIVDATPKTDESGRDWLKELAETDSDVELISQLGAAARAANASVQVLEVIRSEYLRVKSEVPS